ncbi:hypothetical protein [Myceligenerans pegani]|uniref:Protein kinase domain-containing protein n=1 Tax=Myceligenerans pegani TaxID=2776917 RepID=A0ABR9MS37_9MICO|nr:hypothetical protein [Myceligenerans sp. TRM 65318]MBE1874184.1 hypothetical protein [Myceligenerans sp. TRM 65318]MBE3016456.1 hypothetical protein [Myceligenerans sp. TRM 65318]
MHLIDATELVPVTVPAAGLARDLLVRRLDTLADIDHPSLVRLVTISPSGGDRIDVRLDRPDAADLPTVLASRGPFTAAEASGMVVSIAQALAALHSAGLVHGPVEPTDVLFTPEGMALLRPRLALPAATTAEEPVADVPSLARLAQSVLRTGLMGADGRPAALSGADLALRAELARACAADPRERPEAGTFAARVYGVVPPERVHMPAPDELVEAARTGPISIIGPAAGGRVVRREDVARPHSGPAPGARRRLRGRRGAVLAVAVAGIAFGVGAGALVSVPGLLPTGEAAPASNSSEDEKQTAKKPRTAQQLGADLAAIADRGNPAKAAVELTRLRMLLLTGMPVEVSDIDQAGSPAHAADVALLNRIFFWSKQVSGAEVYVTNAEVVGSQDSGGGHLAKGDPLDAVVVRVEYRISAHIQVGDAGPVQVPESEPRSAMLHLSWTDQGWRVSRVS